MSGILNFPCSSSIDFTKLKLFQRSKYTASEFPLRGKGFVFAFGLVKKYEDKDTRQNFDITLKNEKGNKIFRTENFLLGTAKGGASWFSINTTSNIGYHKDDTYSYNDEDIWYTQTRSFIYSNSFIPTNNDLVRVNASSVWGGSYQFISNSSAIFYFDEWFDFDVNKYGKENMGLNIIAFYIPH